jgi:acetolactate synthase-1/2/3 large subunit
MQTCDVLLAVGARFDDRVIGNPKHFASVERKIVHIDIDPSSISKRVKVDIPIVGDVKDVLQELIAQIKESQTKPDVQVLSAWWGQINEWRKRECLKYKNSTEVIKPQFVIEKLWELTKGRDTYITSDVGQHQMWAAQFCRTTKNRHWLSSGGAGTMGYGFPAAIGAQFAMPDKKVWAICGDGGFQMTLAELATAAIHKLPVKILIINNSYLGMVRQWQELFFDNRLSGVDLEGNPDFVKLAGAYGIKGWRIKRPAEVDRILKAAMAFTEGPCLVEAEVIKEDNVFPMIPAGAALRDMIIERPKQKMAKPEGST